MISPQVKDVCKIGQGHACCKYLICGTNGFECAKVLPSMKAYLDKRTDMSAKSDNCEGKEGAL